ncbi:DUF2797 domain-containing protein [Arthrobacter castelli]|uniref:DUF2797 domain-containing protein n=1 Tax=Arthrobacter castelli TaxID=271431 RepID=UPI0003FA6986|nr:DUF2797 domain-containing protein [Arthrobacter castelli]
MKAGRFLVRGVTWDECGAGLALSTAEGAHQRLSLQPGADVRFIVLTLPSIRHCLGYSRVHGPQERELVECPDRAHAERGFFCGPCFARDDFRHLHDIHRSGIAPAGMRAYVDQQHWLYVATFADGTCKVGTASHRSKFSRLAEQGAVAARYVAWAQDGRIVRHLEDAVTDHLGLVQAVRSVSKFAALANPLPADEVDSINAAEAARVRQMLDGGGGPGEYSIPGAGESPTAAHTVDEQWPRPAGTAAVCENRTAVAYPHDPAAGAHGLKLQAVHGSFARAGIDHSDVAFLVDLGRLKGKWIEFGRHQSEVPPVQESLF